MDSLIPLSSFFSDDELAFLQEEPFLTWKHEYNAKHNNVTEESTRSIPRKRPRRDVNAEYNRSVKAKESGEYIPEFIVDIISGNRNKQNGQLLRKELRVKVRWAGYSANFDTWESYNTIKHNIVFHQYCRRNNLEYLIPGKYNLKY